MLQNCILQREWIIIQSNPKQNQSPTHLFALRPALTSTPDLSSMEHGFQVLKTKLMYTYIERVSWYSNVACMDSSPCWLWEVALVWEWFCVSHLLWASGCDGVGFIEGSCIWLHWYSSLLTAHTTNTAVKCCLSVQVCHVARSKVTWFMMDQLLHCELCNEDVVIFHLSVQVRAYCSAV